MPLLRLLIALGLGFFLVHPSSARGQTGELNGRVYDEESNDPLPGATIRLIGSAAGARQIGAIATSKGEFVIRSIPVGSYRVVVTFLSYRPLELSVVIESGEATTITAAMTPGVVGLGQVVVTASKRPEKATSAPASVTVVDAATIDAQPVISVVEHVRGVPGLDIVQSGVSQNMVVARGFNNAFSGSLSVLTDYRIASVPSLRFNAYNFVPLVNEDIQQIEIVRGPGSALYGPNNANGVLHFLTRSPFTSVGTWGSFTAGERDVFQAMARHAGSISDRIGYRISAQYMTGSDWEYVDSAEVEARREFLADPVNAGANPDTVRIGLRDNSIERLAGELRLDYLPTDDISLVLSIGMNDAIRNLDITGVGGAQARDWLYTYYQLRATWNDFFAQIFLNRSDAGDSYLLQSGAPVIDRSSLMVAQLQHGASPVDGLNLTYGADLLSTTPVTDSTITGGNETDDGIVEVGIYAQGDWGVVPGVLSALGAVRFDHHSRLDDPIISPRLALVLTPGADQMARLTYNSAYSAPTTNDMFLDILVRRTPAIDVRASGLSRSGFTFRRGPDGLPLVRSSFSDDRERHMPLGDLRGPTVWTNLITLVNEALRGLGGDTLRGIAPPPDDIPLHLRTLNRETGAFDSSGYPLEVPPIRPTINRTIELGYQGVFFDRFVVGIDLYRSHYTDFVGTLGTVTANVFYDIDVLRGHLMAELIRTGFADSSIAPFYADLLATQIAGRPGDPSATGAPIATISPEQATDPTAVFFAPRNFGSITLYGVDISLRGTLLPGVTLSGTLSYVDRNFFENLDGVGDLSLNAPRFKYALGADYINLQLGVDVSVLLRHVNGFHVSSGVYVGDVAGYSLLDAAVGWKLPFIDGVQVTLSAQNLLTFVQGVDENPFTARHAEFVGTPSIGRMALLRLTYQFP